MGRIEQIESFLREYARLITDGRDLPYLSLDDIIGGIRRACVGNEKLAQCSLPSLATAARHAYQCQLPTDPAFQMLALVPRKGECHGDRMYRGMLELAYRPDNSGYRAVKVVRPYTVYDGETFDVDLGTKCFVTYKPSKTLTDKDRVWESVLASYAIAEIDGGAQYPAIVWRAELEEIREAAIKKSSNTPWIKWFDAMCRKTAIRRVCSYLPQNPYLSYALGLEGLDEAGKLSAVDPVFAGVHDKPIPTNTNGLAKAVGVEAQEETPKTPLPVRRTQTGAELQAEMNRIQGKETNLREEPDEPEEGSMDDEKDKIVSEIMAFVTSKDKAADAVRKGLGMEAAETVNVEALERWDVAALAGVLKELRNA